VKSDNPIVQQKTPSPTIKPARKAPPPPILGNKAPQAATQVNGDAIGNNKQVESDLSPKSPATFQEVKHTAEKLQQEHRIQDHLLPLQQQQQQPINGKHLNKSLSCNEIVNSQDRRVPPPPPVRDSSLSVESYDEHGDDKDCSGQDPKQGRVNKPVPKRRTKSIHQ